MHQVEPPFAKSGGSREVRIALVGEAQGATEQMFGAPFLGSSGFELATMLYASDIASSAPEYPDGSALNPLDFIEWWRTQSNCFTTNVIAGRPSPTSNQFELLCGTKAEVGGKAYEFPAVKKSKYLRPEYLPELERLQMELMQVRPNIIVALGGVASWALLRASAITQIRGAVAPCALVPGAKVLPTFHPQYVLRVWKDRPIVLCDLAKVKRESEFVEWRRPKRNVIVNPTLEELRKWARETLAAPPPIMGCDIETFNGQIESIGFARSRSEAIVCPFIAKPNWHSYWPTHAEECEARVLCQELLGSGIPIVGQNFLYDLQYLLREGFRPRRCTYDTMLLHHSMYPELQKSLGFLGSCYTDEPAWKLMRKRAKEEELKRDD